MMGWHCDMFISYLWLVTPLWDWLGDWVENRASKQLATQFATIYMCSCQNTSPDSPEISALDKRIIHIHACQTPFMSIYLHIQILYTCIDCVCVHMYIYYHFQQNISKNHVTFRFSNLPSPPGPCDLTGQKGGGPKSLQTKFDTPSSEDMSDNKITNFIQFQQKKTFKWQLDLGLPDQTSPWLPRLVEKLGRCLGAIQTHVDNMCCCFFKSSKQFT